MYEQLTIFTQPKRCSRCKEIRPTTEFYASVRSRDNLDCWCKPCRRESNRLSHERNRAKRLERQKQYYEDNRESVRQRQNEYARQNAQANRERVAKWQKENPEKRREAGLRWYRKNSPKLREKINERQRQRRKEKPESNRRAAINRRARLAKADGEFTVQEWKALADFYENTCLRCGKQGSITIDHVVPLSKDGRNDIGNLQPLCLSCNCKKRDRIQDYRDPYLHGVFLERVQAL